MAHLEPVVVGTIQEPERISWALGYTLQPRSFESLRVDVRIEGFKEPHESMKEASDRVYAFAEQELKNKIREARREIAE